jgi:Tfp pilus assembly protein PilF
VNIEKLEELLAAGHDSAMLRFGLGKAYFDNGEWLEAEEHLRAAIKLQPDYSAAWQLLGQAQQAAGELDAALDAFKQGMQIAETNGDQQAYKVMRVMKKRVESAQ